MILDVLSTYRDVQQKAKTIFLEDRVHLVRVRPYPTKTFEKVNYIECIVEGDNDVYISKITLRKGGRAIAAWSCTCPWYKYVWDRSPGYKHLEGRLCSHALASYYFYQSGRMKQEWEKWMPKEKAASETNRDQLLEKIKNEHKQYMVEGAKARNIDDLTGNFTIIDLTGLEPDDLVNLLQNIFLK